MARLRTQTQRPELVEDVIALLERWRDRCDRWARADTMPVAGAAAERDRAAAKLDQLAAAEPIQVPGWQVHRPGAGLCLLWPDGAVESLTR